MSHAAALSRPEGMTFVRLLCLLLGLFLGVNGGLMLARPDAWYLAVPGVIETGPLNTHFVRDIGAVYVLIGVGLLLAAARPRDGTPFVAAGAAWLLAHAGVHLAELTVCGDPMAVFLRDLPGVHGPALLAAGLAAWLYLRRDRHAELAAAA
jgi:hypothetical protein